MTTLNDKQTEKYSFNLKKLSNLIQQLFLPEWIVSCKKIEI